MKTWMATLLIGLGLSSIGMGQSLEQKMLKQLGPCWETLQEEGEEYYTLEDKQVKNGYLSISGGWPTCGCGCEATLAAFKDAQKAYTFVRWEDWNCAQEFGLYTSRAIEDVLPKDFSLNSFVSKENAAINFQSNSYFYIEAQLPIYGTDVPVKLKPLPLGMVGSSKNGLVYNTQSIEILDRAAANLRNIANVLESEEQLGWLRTNNLNKLPKELQERIDKILKQHYQYTWAKFHALLEQAYVAYNVYIQLDFEEAVLGWDRTSARFFLKSKSKKPKLKTFLEFLRTTKTYEVIC